MEIKPGYIRITDVLFPFSGLKNIDPHILKNAAERGGRVHEICTALMNDLGVLDMDIKLDGYIKSFEQWVEDKVFISNPGRFYCDELKITGECDGIYQDGEDLVLFDIKTPLKESKTWPLQCSAYQYLANKSGYDIKRIEVIKLCKEGKAPTIYTYKDNFETFLKCLDLYKMFFKGKEEDYLQDL